MATLSPQISELIEAFRAALLPGDRLPLSEWCDRHRRLSPEGSASSGQWRTLPFQREPLDCMSPHSAYREVVLMWSSQVGKSEAMFNLVANAVSEDPGPILMVQPTLPMCEAVSKDRIAPMFRDTPILRGKVADPKSRDAGSTIFHRRFTGGHLTIVGANSAAGLASRPIRYLLMDEVDRWEESAGAEGDQITLATARTRTFWNRKIVMVSSPTVKGESRIEAAFLRSDQRFFHVPCPMCGHFQRFTWARVVWAENQPETAAYRCAGCEQMIDHRHKTAMVEAGRWVATNPESKIAGFHLSELYSPWRGWGELAVEWLKCHGNPEARRAFINTSLAELWDAEAIGRVTEKVLMARRENIGARLPDDVALITAGVDVQGDRVEVSFYGWGEGEEAWLLNHRIIHGDPSAQGVWLALDQELLRTWPHTLVGELPVHATCIDSGYQTEAVTRFCEQRRGRRVWAIKGEDGPNKPIWPRRMSKAKKGNVYLVGTDAAKSTIYDRLSYESGPGAYHWPSTVELGFFEQLNSEYMATDYHRGKPVRRWMRRKMNGTPRAAEVLDCAVYAYAAVCGLRLVAGIHLEVEADKIALIRQAMSIRVEKKDTTPAAKRSGWFASDSPAFSNRQGGWFAK